MWFETAVGDRVDPILAFHDVSGLVQKLLDGLVFPLLFVIIVARLAQRFVELDSTARRLGPF